MALFLGTGELVSIDFLQGWLDEIIVFHEIDVHVVYLWLKKSGGIDFLEFEPLRVKTCNEESL